jgi:hypothetical protein
VHISEPDGNCRILKDFLHSLDETADDCLPSPSQTSSVARVQQQRSGDLGLSVPVEPFHLISVIRSLLSCTDAGDSSLSPAAAATGPLLAEPTFPALIEHLLSLRDLAGALVQKLQGQLKIQQAQSAELAVLQTECSRRFQYIQRCDEFASKISSLERRHAEMLEQSTTQRASHKASVRDLDARLSAALADAQRLRQQVSSQQQEAQRCAALEVRLNDAQSRCADLQEQLSQVCLELERYYLSSIENAPASVSPASVSDSASPSLIAERESVVINQNRCRLLTSV